MAKDVKKPGKKDDPSKAFARKMLKSPDYRATLQKKLDDGTCHPSIQVALMHYAWGKPKETIETTHHVPVRIEHVFAAPIARKALPADVGPVDDDENEPD